MLRNFGAAKESHICPCCDRNSKAPLYSLWTSLEDIPELSSGVVAFFKVLKMMIFILFVWCIFNFFWAKRFSEGNFCQDKIFTMKDLNDLRFYDCQLNIFTKYSIANVGVFTEPTFSYPHLILITVSTILVFLFIIYLKRDSEKRDYEISTVSNYSIMLENVQKDIPTSAIKEYIERLAQHSGLELKVYHVIRLQNIKLIKAYYDDLNMMKRKLIHVTVEDIERIRRLLEDKIKEMTQIQDPKRNERFAFVLFEQKYSNLQFLDCWRKTSKNIKIREATALIGANRAKSVTSWSVSKGPGETDIHWINESLGFSFIMKIGGFFGGYGLTINFMEIIGMEYARFFEKESVTFTTGEYVKLALVIAFFHILSLRVLTQWYDNFIRNYFFSGTKKYFHSRTEGGSLWVFVLHYYSTVDLLVYRRPPELTDATLDLNNVGGVARFGSILYINSRHRDSCNIFSYVFGSFCPPIS